jgi:hypothetical protein
VAENPGKPMKECPTSVPEEELGFAVECATPPMAFADQGKDSFTPSQINASHHLPTCWYCRLSSASYLIPALHSHRSTVPPAHYPTAPLLNRPAAKD